MSAPCNILFLNLCETNKGEGPSPTYLLLRRGCLSLPKSSFKKNVYFFPIFSISLVFDIYVEERIFINKKGARKG